MKINGRTVALSEPVSLSEMLRREGWLDAERIAVECNGHIVRREQWASTICNDGDVIEVVHFVGGG